MTTNLYIMRKNNFGVQPLSPPFHLQIDAEATFFSQHAECQPFSFFSPSCFAPRFHPQYYHQETECDASADHPSLSSSQRCVCSPRADPNSCKSVSATLQYCSPSPQTAGISNVLNFHAYTSLSIDDSLLRCFQKKKYLQLQWALYYAVSNFSGVREWDKLPPPGQRLVTG